MEELIKHSLDSYRVGLYIVTSFSTGADCPRHRGTKYGMRHFAVDGPGGLILRGDHQQRDRPQTDSQSIIQTTYNWERTFTRGRIHQKCGSPCDVDNYSVNIR